MSLVVQDNISECDGVILQITQNNTWQHIRREAAKLLQKTRESRMIEKIVVLVYLAESARFANLHGPTNMRSADKILWQKT